MFEWLLSLFKSLKTPEPKTEAPKVEAPVEPPKAEAPKTIPEAIVAEARKHLGKTEVGANNHGPIVKECLGFFGMEEGSAWCMAFAQYCVHKALKPLGVKPKIVKSAGVWDTWEKSPKELKLSRPEVGSLVIWRKKGTFAGHAGIVTMVQGDKFTTIEGNTSPGAGINRDGDGVYEKRRDMKGYGSMELIGFLKVV